MARTRLARAVVVVVEGAQAADDLDYLIEERIETREPEGASLETERKRAWVHRGPREDSGIP